MKRLTTYIIVIIIAVSSIGGALAVNEFYLKEDESSSDEMVVDDGDIVTVHYVGWLEDERIYDEARIFDSSKDVQNISNVRARKTIVTFDEKDRGEPFQFTVGENVIEGWSENTKGMKKGQTKKFTVPPNKGYSAHSEDLIMEVNKTETVPIYYEMRVDTFETKYGMSPSSQLTVQHEFWNWTTRVTSVEGQIVNLKNEPEQGETYSTYKHGTFGWRSEVSQIDYSEGEIVVEHITSERTVVDAVHLAKHDRKFREVSQIKRNIGQNPRDTQGVVVDHGEKITIDFNPEVNGKTLHFKMTVLDIQKGE